MPASLKPGKKADKYVYGALFPALISAGLIEAIAKTTCSPTVHLFPALISAGLIEATCEAQAWTILKLFPALISAGLIEAVDIAAGDTGRTDFRH